MDILVLTYMYFYIFNAQMYFCFFFDLVKFYFPQNIVWQLSTHNNKKKKLTFSTGSCETETLLSTSYTLLCYLFSSILLIIITDTHLYTNYTIIYINSIITSL